MDAIGGCDPYVKLQIGAQTHQTTTKKNVYDADFGQYFDFMTVSRNDTLKVNGCVCFKYIVCAILSALFGVLILTSGKF